MAAFHLDKLVEAGLLRTEYRRLSGRTGRGAGRPAKLYRRSRRRFDVTIPQRDPELLARLLAESIADSTGGPSLEAAQRYGHLVGVRARRRLAEADHEGRARCVEDVMADIGFEPVTTQADIRARNCPFEPLSRDYPAVVCQAAIAIVDGVIKGVGADSLSVSRQPGAEWCCVLVTRDVASTGAI
jgi:predicted ArsR family transcriptional regulator